MNTKSSPQRRRPIVRAVVLILLLVVMGAAIYLYQSRGGSMHGLFSSVKATSADAATTTKVKTALALSERVSAFDINVDSENRTVTLTGEVPSDEIKSLAGAIADDTEGVQQVRNNLTVDPLARPNTEIKRLNERIADLELKVRVNETLSQNRHINAKAIDVQVENKKVTLTGSVETPAQKYEAEGMAREVEGVVALDNKLSVTQLSAPESLDEKLARKVEFELYSTQAFNLSEVQIVAQKGVISLSGPVRSRAEKLLAEMVAKTVEGVERVINNLEVPEEAAT